MGKWMWSVAAAALVAPQPVAAADLLDTSRAEHRVGAFAGATLTLGLDGSRERPAPARLGLGISRIRLSSAWPGRVDRTQSPGLELALAGGGPKLTIAGQEADAAQRRLGMNSTTTTLLILGGLAVAAFAIVELTGDDDGDDDGPCPIAPPC